MLGGARAHGLMRRAVGWLRSAALARGLRCWALQRNASAARAAAEGRLRVAVGRMRLRTLAACFRACAQLLVLRRQREARSSAAMWARALGHDRQAGLTVTLARSLSLTLPRALTTTRIPTPTPTSTLALITRP